MLSRHNKFNESAESVCGLYAGAANVSIFHKIFVNTDCAACNKVSVIVRKIK